MSKMKALFTKVYQTACIASPTPLGKRSRVQTSTLHQILPPIIRRTIPDNVAFVKQRLMTWPPME